jgi:small conductance mechanosensitive channel
VDDQIATINHMKTTAFDLAVRFGPKVLAAVVILLVGIAVSRGLARGLDRSLQRFELEPPVRILLGRVGWLMSMALFVVLALQNLGVELLPLIAGLSVAGAGIALATQGVLSNLVAGLTIIFTKPFRVGEYISIAGEEGVVENVSLFSTTLGHVDRSRIVIPNRKIVGEILHNFGKIRQLDITVQVAQNTHLESAMRAIAEILQANARVLKDPAPVVAAVTLGEWSVTIAVRPWVAVADYAPATGELNAALLESFRERGIIMPVPQREVRLIGTPAAP